MKKLNLITLILLFISTILTANTDRALYIKQYSNESKTALVIGNSKYKHFSKLKNSKNDAYDMQKVLKSQGFDILYLQDGTLKDMKKIVRKFTKKLRNGGVGFFFYAGHGLEVDGKNYLIPTNANIPEKDEVEYESLSMNMIIDKMENSNNRLNIVVLDACRNDPFSRSGGGGLAQINNAKGMYIAFATSPGSVASDGNKNERNGLFTKHLIKNIKQSNLELDRVFKNTRIGVSDESNDKQRPWTSSSVNGDFYFKIDKDNVQAESKRKEYPKKKSSFSFDDVAPTSFSLTINPTPYNAKVHIMNIKEKYFDGIKLKSGKYEISVSAQGYHTKTGTVDLQNDLTVNIVLEKDEKPKINPIDTFTLDNYYISIGSSKTEDLGNKMCRKFKVITDKCHVVKIKIKNNLYYKILIGSYPSKSEAKIALELMKKFQPHAYILKYNLQKNSKMSQPKLIKEKDEKDDWKKIENSTCADDFQFFLDEYPNSYFATSAKEKFNKFLNNEPMKAPKITLAQLSNGAFIINWIHCKQGKNIAYTIIRIHKEGFFKEEIKKEIVGIKEKRFVDKDIKNEVVYNYTIQAIDELGNLSLKSNVISMKHPKIISLK